jgi:hypothetical protein
MRSAGNKELEQRERPLSARMKRAVRPALKTAPAKEALRGWAKSGIKGRNKS